MSTNVIPYVSIADIWKKHFLNMANDDRKQQKRIYIVNKYQSGDGDDAIIKMVTPTKEAVDRARAAIKKENELSPPDEKSWSYKKERSAKKRIHSKEGKQNKKSQSKKKKKNQSTLKKFKFSL